MKGKGTGKGEGWIARRLTTLRGLRNDPRSAGPLLRAALVRIWATRGGGFYGLGYLVSFVVLEIQMIVGEFADSANVGEFIVAQLLETLLRIGLMSFVNGILAAIWPVYVLDWFEGIGIVLLIAGYFVFEKLLKPIVEAYIPDLGDARRVLKKRSD